MRGGQGYAGTAESLPVAHLVRSLGISHYTIGTPTAPRWTHSPSRFGLCSNYPCFSFYGLYFFHFSRRDRGQGKLCGIPAHTGARPSMIKPKTNCLAEHVHAELTTARLSVCFLLLPFFFQSLCYVTVSQPLVAGQERENRHEPQGGGALRELEHSRVCQLRVRALPRRSFLQTKRTSAASSLVPWPLYLSLFLLSFSRFLPRFFSFSASPTLSFFAPLLSISLLDPTSHPSISPSTSLSVEREGPPWPPRPSLL